MTDAIQRRVVLRAGLAVGVSLLAPSVRACEFFSSNLRIYRPWSRASVAGATTAMLSMTFDEVREDDRLVHVETPVAEAAALGGIGAAARIDFAIPEGRESVLHESTTYVHLLRLRHPLEVAREYPLTLFFERGGAVAADFDIDYV